MEKLSGISNTSAFQEDVDTVKSTSHHLEQHKTSQELPHATQGATEEEDPITHWTQGRLPRQHPVANKATKGRDLGESVPDQEHTEHLFLQDRMCHPVVFLADVCGGVMYFCAGHPPARS